MKYTWDVFSIDLLKTSHSAESANILTLEPLVSFLTNGLKSKTSNLDQVYAHSCLVYIY